MKHIPDHLFKNIILLLIIIFFKLFFSTIEAFNATQKDDEMVKGELLFFVFFFTDALIKCHRHGRESIMSVILAVCEVKKPSIEATIRTD